MLNSEPFSVTRARTGHLMLQFLDSVTPKGVRDLVRDFGLGHLIDDDISRGRQICIAKIDMCGSKELFSNIPHGMRKILLNHWIRTLYSFIGKEIFYHKTEGDGGLYYFYENEKTDLKITKIFESVKKISQYSGSRFDKEIYKIIEEKLKKDPGVKPYWEMWKLKYSEVKGEPFESRITQTKNVLHFGFVDEGFWGVREAGEYDMQGDNVVIAQFLDKKVNPNEIIMTKAFLDELAKENKELVESLKLLKETVDTKSALGSIEIYRYTPEQNKLKLAS